MKNLFKLPVLVLGLIFLLAGSTQKAVAQDDDISLQTFYDELSPYGVWIQDPEYGYVWRPDVDQSEFRPYYTNGRWVMTEYGNTWVSEYDWGWAPFHYGRWILNRYNHWIWIPDTTWGPAWVSWRSGGGYYGWAPLAPGINININFGGGYHIPNSWWVFVPQRNIYYDRFPRYRGHRNVNIFNHTTIINYTGQRDRHTYYTGPRRDDIRRATNRDVRVYNVNRTDRSQRTSISNNTVNIYNPRTNRNVDNRNAAPRKVSSENAYTGSRSDRNNNNANNRTGANRNDAATRSDEARRTRTTERNNNAPNANADRNTNVDRNNGRANREATTTRERSDAAERAERVQRQGQDQASREQQAETQQRVQAQQRERVQRQAQDQQERAQRQELNRQQQAREQSGQQQERTQPSRTQSAPREQAQPQQRQREPQSAPRQQVQQQRQQSAPRQQVQQPRQERVQQSAPSRSNENRSRAQSQSNGRASRGDRG